MNVQIFLIFFLWLGPDQRKEWLKFGLDLDHLLDAKKRLNFQSSPFPYMFNDLFSGSLYSKSNQQIFMKISIWLVPDQRKKVTSFWKRLGTKKIPNLSEMPPGGGLSSTSAFYFLYVTVYKTVYAFAIRQRNFILVPHSLSPMLS